MARAIRYDDRSYTVNQAIYTLIESLWDSSVNQFTNLRAEKSVLCRLGFRAGISCYA
jgi:hypothetical protein